MTRDKLHLSIEFDGAAMLTAEDAAQALRPVVASLAAGATDGMVFDANGNKVGGWEIRQWDDDGPVDPFGPPKEGIA